jgi:hypothetical protein
MTRALRAGLRAGPRRPWRERPGRTIGVAAGVVVVAVWLTLVEVFWLPLRVGLVPVPISIAVAVAANLLLTGLAHRISGSRLVGVLPALIWLVISLAATMRRPEGDLVLVGGGTAGAVNLTYLLLGVVSAAFGAGRVLAARAPAGSGTGGAR